MPHLPLSASLLKQNGFNVDLVIGSLQTNLGSWLQSYIPAYTSLLTSLVKNMSTFSRPLFLHNASLLALASNDSARIGRVVKAVPLGGRLGRLSLEMTRLPPQAAGYGFLVLALDPLARLPDPNRTDNLFVQFVNVNNNHSWDDRAPFTCSVSAINSGKLKNNCTCFLHSMNY